MHIVIITHYYPPLNAIASLRPLSFAKYFVEQGIKVTVLTTQKKTSEGYLDLEGFHHSNLNIVEVPYSSLKFWQKQNIESSPIPSNPAAFHASREGHGVLTKWRKAIVGQVGSLVDYQFFWTGIGVKKLKEIHKHAPIDLMISTYSPPAAHYIASKVKAIFPQIKWIADYRDLWCLNHVMAAKGILNGVERIIEKKTIQNADFLTTVSAPLAADLSNMVKGSIPVSVIFNGYPSHTQVADAGEEISSILPIKIVYTGTIYKGRRDPTPLIIALNELEQEGVLKVGDVEIDFYGTNTSNLDSIIESSDGDKWAKIKGYISYQKSLEIQRSANFLLFLESGAIDARGVLTGKLFEYLIAGKPILALGIDKHSAAAQVIAETQTGYIFGEDKDKIKDFFKRYLSYPPQHPYAPNTLAIQSYSREEQARKLLDIAKSLLA
jgi:glycosyltransferase involved in cell wall biosynthesis